MAADRTILIDNATLSGVERLIGESKIINLSNIENDILCFEKLVTSILFSDKIVGVDDYKEHYRSERLKKFSFVDFLKLPPETYSNISEDAAAFAKSMVFSFDGSKPAGDVLAFFESLRIDPQLRWDVFVSSEYLTMSLLVTDIRNSKYETAIDSIFRNESTDAKFVDNDMDPRSIVSVKDHPSISDIKGLVHSLSSGNPNYKGPSGKSILQRCVFGYGWAAERSYFYNAVAALSGADAFLAPLRDAFCESCCRLESRSQANSLLDKLKSKSQDTVAKIVDTSGRARFAIKLPFFTTYLISNSENPRQCIDLALKLREERQFRDCRVILDNLSHLSTQERYVEVNSILKLLEQSCNSLMKSYAVSTSNGPQVSLSLGITGPSISMGLKLERLFAPYRNKPFSRLFRNISQDMLNIEHMGGLHNKLLSSIREHKDSKYAQVSVTPKFMEDKESSTGRPADFYK